MGKGQSRNGGKADELIWYSLHIPYKVRPRWTRSPRFERTGPGIGPEAWADKDVAITAPVGRGRALTHRRGEQRRPAGLGLP